MELLQEMKVEESSFNTFMLNELRIGEEENLRFCQFCETWIKPEDALMWKEESCCVNCFKTQLEASRQEIKKKVSK